MALCLSHPKLVSLATLPPELELSWTVCSLSYGAAGRVSQHVLSCAGGLPSSSCWYTDVSCSPWQDAESVLACLSSPWVLLNGVDAVVMWSGWRVMTPGVAVEGRTAMSGRMTHHSDLLPALIDSCNKESVSG